MKNLKKILVCVVIFMLTFVIKVEALSVEKSEIIIEKGNSESIGLSLNVREGIEIKSIVFDLVFSTYDIPANFKVASGYVNSGSGISHKIVFDTPVTGSIRIGSIDVSVVESPKDLSGMIRINNAKAITSTSEEVSLVNPSISINVKSKEVVDTPDIEYNTTNNVTNDNVTEMKKEEEETVNTTETTIVDDDKNEEDKKDDVVDKTEDTKDEEKILLKEIQSEIVKIKLKENVFEYNVKVKDGVEELDLKPILNDDSYEVNISSQKISELKDNKITITISKDEEKIDYVINVKVVSSDIEIDNSTAPIYNYKGKWITVIIVFSVILVVGLFFIKKR